MPGHSFFFPNGEPRGARPRAGRLLIAVPWRQAGLIALCAFAGAAATTLASMRQPPVVASATQVRPRVPQRVAPSPEADASSALRLDLEPGNFRENDATRLADASEPPPSSPRVDDAHPLDEIDAALRQAPPAAGRIVGNVAGRPLPGPEAPGLAALPGLVAGLLLGLLLAALRELHGGRMRSPREAEWALGVPVLGAIPTLSAKAREAAVTGPVPLDEPLGRE
jgi:hypothetical protein